MTPLRAKLANGYPFWIPGYFEGQDVYILGSGPSLTGFDFDILKNKNVIACCHMINFCNAEFVVFVDDSVPAGLTHFPGPDAPFHTITRPEIFQQNSRIKKGPHVTELKTSKKFSANVIQDGAYSRFSSGYYATSIAIAMGARNIYLLGHDASTNGNITHCYDTQAVKKMLLDKDRYYRMKHGWQAFKNCGNIYNLSEQSEIDVFPKIPVNEILK